MKRDDFIMPTVNPSNLLNRMKRRMGTPLRIISLDDNDMMDIVYDETLPIFSNYYPYYVNQMVNMNTDESPGERGLYTIKIDEDIEILGVQRILRATYDMSNGPIIPFSSSNLAQMQMTADLMSMTQNPVTFRFYPPNKVEVFPKNVYTRNFMAVTKCVHPKHLQTIPVNYADTFYTLAEYDIKIVIFEQLQMIDNLNTAFGNIELKLDAFQNARDQRNEFLEKLDNNFLRDQRRQKIIFA